MKEIKEKRKVKNLGEYIISRIETTHIDNSMIKSIEDTYGITAFKNFFDQGFHFAKNNFSVFSALFTAAVIVLTGAFAALDVAYKRSGLSVHHINSIYIETGVKVSFEWIQILSFAVIYIFSNLLVLYVGAFGGRKRWITLNILQSAGFLAIESFLVFLLDISINYNENLIEVMAGAGHVDPNSIGQIAILYFAVTSFMNIHGLVFFFEFLIFEWFNKRKIKKKHLERKKESSDIVEPMNFSNALMLYFCVILVLFSMAMIYQGVAGRKAEWNRTAYKTVVEQASEIDKLDTKCHAFIFELEEREVLLFPVVFENEEVYILSRLYRTEDGGIKMDYDYQKVIGKFNVETYFVEDIYSIK